MKTIKLDGKITSPLKWEEQIVEAQKEKGDLFFELDLGLFDDLPLPLSEESQLLSLQLAVEEFNRKIFKPFQKQIKGLLIFRGRLPFKDPLEGEYIKCLIAELAEEVPLFACVDAEEISSAATFFRAITEECFDHVHLEIKSPFMKKCALGGHSTTALCLPGREEGWERVDEVVEKLATPFRVIPERNLIYAWQGLATLVVIPEGVTEQGWRKLRGFEAAGGVLEAV